MPEGQELAQQSSMHSPAKVSQTDAVEPTLGQSLSLLQDALQYAPREMMPVISMQFPVLHSVSPLQKLP